MRETHKRYIAILICIRKKKYCQITANFLILTCNKNEWITFLPSLIHDDIWKVYNLKQSQEQNMDNLSNQQIVHAGWLIKSPPEKRIWKTVSEFFFDFFPILTNRLIDWFYSFRNGDVVGSYWNHQDKYLDNMCLNIIRIQRVKNLKDKLIWINVNKWMLDYN